MKRKKQIEGYLDTWQEELIRVRAKFERGEIDYAEYARERDFADGHIYALKFVLDIEGV